MRARGGCAVESCQRVCTFHAGWTADSNRWTFGAGVAYNDVPPVGAIRRKENNHGSEEESDEEVEEGQVSAAYQATYSYEQDRQIKPMR